MRLICPNCEAQYEVSQASIPDEGRDVQCSNCGHTWFQLHPRQEAAIEAARADNHADEKTTHDTEAPRIERIAASDRKPRRPEAVRTAPPQPEPVTRPQPEPAEPDYADDYAEVYIPDDDPPPAPPPMPDRKPRELDPRVRDVLRAEAEREERMRSRQTGALESQPDLGLDEPETRRPARRRREAALTDDGASDQPIHAQTTPQNEAEQRDDISESATIAATAAAMGSSSRRGRLPDVEEITSTLRSTSERRQMETAQARADAEVYPPRPRPSGFGSGFRWAVLAVVVLFGIYIIAPRMIGWMPASAVVLNPYVATIDAGRSWLDGVIGGGAGALDALSSEPVQN